MKAAVLAALLVHFKAADGTRLAADFVAPKAGKKTLVLLHGVAAGRKEWSPLVERASREGLGALALDFRGHGESSKPSFETFKEADWAKLELDVEAAVRYLSRRHIMADRICLVGASLGANVALKAAAKNPRIAGVVLLSPGVDYRGIKIEDEFKNFDRPILLAASRSDGYAFSTLVYLQHVAPGAPAVYLQAESGHGAQMLGAGLTEPLLRWLSSL